MFKKVITFIKKMDISEDDDFDTEMYKVIEKAKKGKPSKKTKDKIKWNPDTGKPTFNLYAILRDAPKKEIIDNLKILGLRKTRKTRF